MDEDELNDDDEEEYGDEGEDPAYFFEEALDIETKLYIEKERGRNCPSIYKKN
jgi:hypothetical protein